MSQRKDIIILLLTFLITGGLLGSGLWWLIKLISKSESIIDKSQITNTEISFGNKNLVVSEGSNNLPFQTLKKAGINAIASGKYEQAVSQFQGALNQNRNAPETLIYLNNAEISQQKSHTIAVAVPISTDPNGSLEVLRGVAQAQDEFNRKGGINGVRLKVLIANDKNDENQAKNIAKTLVNNLEVLGVIGHWSSQVTYATVPIYQSGKLVSISPVSTAVNLTNSSPYFFRTVPSDYIAARAIADYTLRKLPKKNVSVFFNSQSTYSQSLKSEFSTAISLGGGQVSSEYDLSNPSFNATQSVEQAARQGAEALMLAANTGTLETALQVVQVNQKRIPLLGGDDIYSVETLQAGEAVEGMVVAVPWHIDASSSDFPRRSKQLWGNVNVNWRTALSYDATQAVIAAITVKPERTGIQQTLSDNNFSIQGASGTIRFLPSGDRYSTVQLVKIVAAKPSRSGTGYDFVPVR